LTFEGHTQKNKCSLGVTAWDIGISLIRI